MQTDSIQLHDLRFRPMLSAEEIQKRVAELGVLLSRECGDSCPIFISVLSGSYVFTSDLTRAFQGNCEVRFVKLSSYQGTNSTGKVQTIMGLGGTVKGRDVIVVEDIVDTGRTLHHYLKQLKTEGPASIRTVSFLVKPDALKFDVQLDHKGFEIDDKFVVGYGLDYDELGRNLAALYVLED